MFTSDSLVVWMLGGMFTLGNLEKGWLGLVILLLLRRL